MDHYAVSLLLAKIISVTFLVFGLGMILNTSIYTSIVKRVIENPLLLFLVGTIDLILGLIIVFIHNDWVSNWTILVTIMGWILVVRGVIRIAFPRLILKMGRKLDGRFRKLVYVATSFCLIYGAILCYFSFFAR